VNVCAGTLLLEIFDIFATSAGTVVISLHRRAKAVIEKIRKKPRSGLADCR
jgi:hypothetical protein